MDLGYRLLSKCLNLIKVKRSLKHPFKPGVKSLEKLEISLDQELVKKIDEIVELLGYNSREEMIQCIIRRFVDKHHSPHIKAPNRFL